MKILIVGGTGLISTAVVNEAVKQGLDVTCVVRGNNHGNKLNSHATLIKGDARDIHFMREALRGKHYEAIIDFVCFSIQGLKDSLEAFHDKCNQYVFISTDSVYKLQKDGNYDETTPQSNPDWDYSYQKADCETYLRKYCKEDNLTYTIIRPSITYGNTRIPYGYMPPYGQHYTLINRIKAGKPVITWNKAQNLQTMIRVEDFAVGLVGLLGNKAAYNEDFNICGDVYRWDDVLCAIEKKINHPIRRVDVPVEAIIKDQPNRRGEFLIDRAADHKVSNKKLKAAVPTFALTYDIDYGVSAAIDYYEESNYILGNDYRYDGKMDNLLKDFTPPHLLKFVNYDSINYFGNYINYLFGYYHNNVLVKSINLVKWAIGLIPRIVRKILKILRINGIRKAK